MRLVQSCKLIVFFLKRGLVNTSRDIQTFVDWLSLKFMLQEHTFSFLNIYDIHEILIARWFNLGITVFSPDFFQAFILRFS